MTGWILPLWAAVMGVVGFMAVEIAGRLAGVRTAMTASLALDVAAFALAAALLAALYQAAWLNGGRFRRVSAGVAYLLLYPFVTAVLAGAASLTLQGEWGFPGAIREALIAGPLNLLATFTIEVGYVAIPIGVVCTYLLARLGFTSMPEA